MAQATSVGKIPEHRLLDDLRTVAATVNGALTERTYAEHGEFGVTTFRRRFGSWNDAKEAAGLDTLDSDAIPKQELLDDLRRVAARVGDTPSERTYAEHGDFGVTTYRRRFGSWRAARRAADLDDETTSVTESDLIAELQRLATEVDGQYVTVSDYRERGRYRLSAFPDDQGFWEQVLDEVGLKVIPLRHEFATEG